MTPTEKTAESWLREKFGCKFVDFNSARTPDFLTEREGFEVKLLKQGGIRFFYKTQIRKIRKTRSTILVFENGKTEPITIIPCLPEDFNRHRLMLYPTARYGLVDKTNECDCVQCKQDETGHGVT